MREQGPVPEIVGNEPDLQLVRPNDVAHEEVVGAVIARLRRLPRHRPRLLQDDFMGMKQSGDLRGNLLTLSRRSRDQRHLRHIMSHGDAHAAQRLDPFRDGVDQLSLFVEVRSEEHTSELQSRFDLVCRLLLEKKNYTIVPSRLITEMSPTCVTLSFTM